ncbi:MAG: polyisoprenoid-binding protein [Micrococcales bacterium]|nr:polyisoprenoid-binding protein [Micrococcales bacterium]
MTDIATHSDYRVGTWTLDPTHSELSFTVRHLAISKVRGVFRSFDVTVTTPEDPAQISVEASVDVASVDTNQEARDNHLRTSDFFLVEEHPTMTFRSTGIRLDGEEFELEGHLTLRGVTKPVTLKGELGGVVTDGWGQTKAGVSATTKINRHDFGVSWNQALEAGGLTLGDEVKIALDIQLVLQP